MLVHGKRDRQRAYRAEIPLGPLLPLAVQSLVFQLRDTLFARSLVLLAMGFLAVHAAVLDEVASRAVLELDAVVVSFLAAVGAGLGCFRRRGDRDAAHLWAGIVL